MLYRRRETSEYIWGLISTSSHFTGLVFPVNFIFRFEKCCTSCKRNRIRAVFKTTKERWKRQIALIQVWRTLLVIFRDWVPKKRSACDWVLKGGFLKCLLRAAERIPPERPENVPGRGTGPTQAGALESSQCFCSESRTANSKAGGLREALWGECWAHSSWHGVLCSELPLISDFTHSLCGGMRKKETNFVGKATRHSLVNNKWKNQSGKGRCCILLQCVHFAGCPSIPHTTAGFVSPGVSPLFCHTKMSAGSVWATLPLLLSLCICTAPLLYKPPGLEGWDGSVLWERGKCLTQTRRIAVRPWLNVDIRVWACLVD